MALVFLPDWVTEQMCFSPCGFTNYGSFLGKSWILAEVALEEKRAGAASMQSAESSHAGTRVSTLCEMS